MFFGKIRVAEALGAIVGHTLRAGEVVLKKGTVLREADLRALSAAGYAEIIAARLDDSDVPEDVAAAEIGAAVAGPGVRAAPAATGRCNLHAEVDGVLRVDRARVDRLNLLDEAVTLATIAPDAPVRAGDMIATVKIIPFAAPRPVVDASVAAGQAITVAPFAPWTAGLVLTRLPGTKESVLDRAAGAQRVRAERSGGRIGRELRCDHQEETVAAAIRELLAAGTSPVLVLGASAIVDRRDVIPSAIERAGGEVIHLGMPVDPGNLMLIGRQGATPILGVPGCARSLQRSGFDMVLERLAAGIDTSRPYVMSMGVGGLLNEIPSRPLPRAGDHPLVEIEPAVAAVVLAAGRSSRMGEQNKLLADVDGAPMIARVADAILATSVRPVVVVTGHDDARVRQALGAREAIFAHNPRYAEGMSTSLRCGLDQLGEDLDGALVCLGDMPRVQPAHIEALLGSFDPGSGRAICVPTWERRRGNPVLFASRFFPEMRRIEGDVGARALLEKYAAFVCHVPMADRGVTLDVDTPEALEALGRTPSS